jgi:cation:H+ antiporter
MIGWLLLVAAAALLVGGAELFVENAAGAARRLGVTVLAVGVLLAGAEPEELLTAVIAAFRDRPGLAVGDAVGANVTMLTACLGLAAVVRPLHVGRRVRGYAGLSAVAGLLALLVLLDERVGRIEGALLVLAYVGLVALVWWRERQPPALGELAEIGEHRADGDEEQEERAPAVALLLALLGVALMIGGGDLAVRGAERVVSSLTSTDSAVGLTILAFATTSELFALVFAAARHDVPEIAVAGVVGSAAYNATATLGTAALARPLATSGVVWPAVAAVLLPVVVVLLARGGRLTRVAGILLLAGYVVYLVLVLALGEPSGTG